MASTILKLSELITDSTSALVDVCDANSLVFPALSDTFIPESEAFRSITAAADASNKIVAAAFQLAAIVSPPEKSIFSMTAGHFKSAALRVCMESNVTEILREAGPNGLHVNEISAKCGLDSMKLDRLLRVLATHHVYREVTPNVFTNNRVSGAMDTGKSVAKLQEDPESKHDGTLGIVAMAEHFLTDGHKITANMLENLKDPKTTRSDEPEAAVFYTSFPDVDVPIWDWYEQPDQSYRRRRFAVAMHGLGALQPPDLILKAFDWNSLPKQSLVVDVGGGIGTSALKLAKTFPDLRIVVQDIPNVIKEGQQVWARELPEAIESGRVALQSHSFFEPQPVENANVFILKQVLHDWSDKYSRKILTLLREVATPSTRLLVLDNIVAYACSDPSVDKDGDGSAVSYREAPSPLLPNFGAANHMGYTIDMAMLMWHNSQERTAGQMDRLLKSCGWQIVRVQRNDPPSNFFEPVEAMPV